MRYYYCAKFLNSSTSCCVLLIILFDSRRLKRRRHMLKRSKLWRMKKWKQKGKRFVLTFSQVCHYDFFSCCSTGVLFLVDISRRKCKQKVTAMKKSSKFIILSSCQWVGMENLSLTGCINYMDWARYALQSERHLHVRLLLLNTSKLLPSSFTEELLKYQKQSPLYARIYFLLLAD